MVFGVLQQDGTSPTRQLQTFSERSIAHNNRENARESKHAGWRLAGPLDAA